MKLYTKTHGQEFFRYEGDPVSCFDYCRNNSLKVSRIDGTAEEREELDALLFGNHPSGFNANVAKESEMTHNALEYGPHGGIASGEEEAYVAPVMDFSGKANEQRPQHNAASVDPYAVPLFNSLPDTELPGEPSMQTFDWDECEVTPCPSDETAYVAPQINWADDDQDTRRQNVDSGAGESPYIAPSLF